MFWLNGEFSLGLSKDVNSRKTPPKALPERDRRGKGITSYGKRMVRSALYWLQKEHGKKSIAFLTCTVPTLGHRATNRIVTKWSKVVKRYREALQLELEKAGIVPEIVLVTEIQEKRYLETGEVLPHLHIAFQGRKSGRDDWAITKERARELWENVLTSAAKTKVEAPAATRIESVRKSIENYLSKYMSKGGKVIKDIIDKGFKDMLPTAWWGMTRSLSKRVREGRRNVAREDLSFLYDNREALKEAGILQWFHVVTIDYVSLSNNKSARSDLFPRETIITIPVAMVGKLSDPNYANSFPEKEMSGIEVEPNRAKLHEKGLQTDTTQCVEICLHSDWAETLQALH